MDVSLWSSTDHGSLALYEPTWEKLSIPARLSCSLFPLSRLAGCWVYYTAYGTGSIGAVGPDQPGCSVNSHLCLATPENMAYQHHSGCIVRWSTTWELLNILARPQCFPVDLLYSVKFAGIKMERGNLLRVDRCEYYGQINIDKCLCKGSHAMQARQISGLAYLIFVSWSLLSICSL